MSKDNHKLLTQRIDSHEKLCRIMQKQTQNQIAGIKKQIARLEKIVISSAAFIIIGLFTLLLALLKYHL
tara:strand:- start:69 stop:275 length:207 start_codon:yes stop_codon:yes gene_type:complete